MINYIEDINKYEKFSYLKANFKKKLEKELLLLENALIFNYNKSSYIKKVIYRLDDINTDKLYITLERLLKKDSSLLAWFSLWTSNNKEGRIYLNVKSDKKLIVNEYVSI